MDIGHSMAQRVRRVIFWKQKVIKPHCLHSELTVDSRDSLFSRKDYLGINMGIVGNAQCYLQSGFCRASQTDRIRKGEPRENQA
jgi:hypothetical protein